MSLFWLICGPSSKCLGFLLYTVGTACRIAERLTRGQAFTQKHSGWQLGPSPMFPAFFSSSPCLPLLYPAQGSHVASWAQTVWNVQPVLSPWPASSHPSVPSADIHSFIHCCSSRIHSFTVSPADIHSFIHCSSSRHSFVHSLFLQQTGPHPPPD